jgi:spore germination protein PC
MNQYDFYEYIRRLHIFVEAQDTRLKQLEEIVKNLSQEISNLKNKPSIKVERMEYKFDQLKVETLEGTLNIGLNPSDLQGIEDFTVQGKPVVNSISPTDLFQITMRIEQNTLNTLESDVRSIITQYEQEKGTKIQEEYVTFILEDIKKQLHQRIEYYLNQLPPDQRTTNLEYENRVIETIKKDMQTGIISFLDNLPSESKG